MRGLLFTSWAATIAALQKDTKINKYGTKHNPNLRRSVYRRREIDSAIGSALWSWRLQD